MNKSSTLICLILCLTVGIACNKDDNRPTEPPRTGADIEADFRAIDLSPGVVDVELEMLNGVFYHFRVISPDRNSGELRPLVVTFHGASNSPDAHKQTACYAEPGLESLGAFILSPNGEGGLWYTPENQNMVGDLMYLARKYWPIDFDKIAVTGYSNGGNACWFFSQFQPDIISAGIPMASSYDVYEQDSTVRTWDVPLYVIHGENDELFPVEQTQEWVNVTVAAGSDVTLVIAPELGHFEPCEYVPYLKDAATWLEEEVWK